MRRELVRHRHHASDLALSRSTVKRALSDLVRLGRVEIQPRYRENGGPDLQPIPIAEMSAGEKAASPPREAASINWTWGRVIVAHQEIP